MREFVQKLTHIIYFVVKQVGPNEFQASFLDSNGNIASLLPDRTLTYTTNNGKTLSITVKGGTAVFTVDANDGEILLVLQLMFLQEKTHSILKPKRYLQPMENHLNIHILLFQIISFMKTLIMLVEMEMAEDLVEVLEAVLMEVMANQIKEVAQLETVHIAKIIIRQIILTTQ